MSSGNVLGSTVFQRVIWSSFWFSLIALALLWCVAGALVWQTDRAQQGRIMDTIGWIEGTYYGSDPDEVYEIIRDDEDIIWSDDVIFEILENNGQVIVWRDSGFDARAGFEGLYGNEGWDITQLDHPVVYDDLRSFRTGLRGGDTLIVAEFLPEFRYTVLYFAQVGTLAILLIILPLSLITGYLLARRVFARIEGITQATDAVATGQMGERAPVSGRFDEFDRLAGGINQMLDQVAALNRNIESVSVGVAHDLRTPLTNIGGRLDLIRRDLDKPDALEGHVEAAEQHLSQLMRVFDALLRLGEVEAGRRRAAFADVSLTELATRMAESYAPVFEDADKVLTSEIDTGIMLHGDQELLEQAVSNLLENALEYARDGARVTLTLRRTGQGADLIVADDGPGVSPADREHLFDRFYRGDKSRGSAGNGLGLALAKSIAELHGAKITLRPDTSGAEFIMSFQTAD